MRDLAGDDRPLIGKLKLIVDGRAVGRAGLHDRMAEQLRRMIVRRELEPGAAVAEAKLCVDLGVSRTPLREALKVLAAEGLVELRPNRSPRISTMRPTEIVELFEAVSGIERVAAEFAAQRLTATELKRLATLQARMERHHEAGQLDPYFQLNQTIHRAIVTGAKNPTLAAAHGWLMGRAERARYSALGTRGRLEESILEHRAVLDALQRRDTVAAGQLLGKHVTRTGTVLAAALKRAVA